MYAVLRDTDFSTRAIRDGRPMHTFKAKELLYKISDATWRCGDPGMQFDTTVNRWHTSKDRKSTRLNSSHLVISYAVFCLKKKNKKTNRPRIGGTLLQDCEEYAIGNPMNTSSAAMPVIP